MSLNCPLVGPTLLTDPHTVKASLSAKGTWNFETWPHCLLTS